MLKSMTGFGRAEMQNEGYVCKVEARSVNNRFLEINARLPKYLSKLEIPLKKLVKDNFSRGSFDITILLEKTEDASPEMEVVPNISLATQYLQALTQLREGLGMKEAIDFKTILNMKDLIKLDPPKLNEDKETMILETVDLALSSLKEMRQEEGKNLQLDINKRLEFILEHTRFIQGRQEGVLKDYMGKIKERVSQLTNGMELDLSRLAQEAALLAERSDISEELTRTISHLNQFFSLLENQQPMGRKLEFLLQEINRETNTIGSKTSDINISRTVIEIKSDLEKIREQIQNVE